MPINYADYGPDWPKVRAAVLERAGHRCEACGVANYARGARDREGKWRDLTEIAGMNSTEGEIVFGGQYPKVIRIVLTTAHLDHDPGNNDKDNLRALCQRCHLQHDIEQHKVNAAATRRAKREQAGQLPLLAAKGGNDAP